MHSLVHDKEQHNMKKIPTLEPNPQSSSSNLFTSSDHPFFKSTHPLETRQFDKSMLPLHLQPLNALFNFTAPNTTVPLKTHTPVVPQFSKTIPYPIQTKTISLQQNQQQCSVDPSVVVDMYKELLKNDKRSEIELPDDFQVVDEDVSELYKELQSSSEFDKYLVKEEIRDKLPGVTVNIVKRKRKREIDDFYATPLMVNNELPPISTEFEDVQVVDPIRVKKKKKLYHLVRTAFDKCFENSNDDPLYDPSSVEYKGEIFELPDKYDAKSFIRTFQEVMSESLTFNPRVSKDDFIKKMEDENEQLNISYSEIKKEKEKEKVDEIAKRWATVVFNIPKHVKEFYNIHGSRMKNAKRTIHHVQKEAAHRVKRSLRIAKEASVRAKKLNKEMLIFWRKYEKELAEKRKREAKEEAERRKREQDLEEARRQQRKLNFLITQTELYSHFMASKDKTKIPANLMVPAPDEKEGDKYTTAEAIETAKKAMLTQIQRTMEFDKEAAKIRTMKSPTKAKTYELSAQTVANINSSSMNVEIQEGEPQYKEPKHFQGKLKKYQLHGLNWLIGLYDQGINGILADEMGLGKTIQTIAFLSFLAEARGIWGPFLVIAPSSTLHNWRQEFEKFCPDLKVLPYWGNIKDRKVLRKFWNPQQLYTKDSPFHVLITSYGLVVEDEKMFRKIKWQYLILDEAHAIKSSKSVRWKTLLSFNCRNRMLLTGTPIQNNMAELWSLLHFIMPSLFDSHDEFNEWFSKDIESHASGQQISLDEQQVQRLHMILKPFMLRRVKRDVESEMAPKVEKTIYCEMSSKQRSLYESIKQMFKKSTDEKSSSNGIESVLANYVMQLRKVCNHPDIFQRQETISPLQFQQPVTIKTQLPKDITGYHPEVTYVNKNPIEFIVPKKLYRSGLTSLPLHSSPFVMGNLNNKIRHKLLFDKLNIFTPEYINKSLHGNMGDKKGEQIVKVDSPFSFIKFIDLSVGEASYLYKSTIIEQFLFNLHRRNRLDRLHYCETESIALRNQAKFLINELSTTSHTHTNSQFLTNDSRHMWKEMVVTDPIQRYLDNKSLLRQCSSSYIKAQAPPIRFFCPDRSFEYQQQDMLNDAWTKKALFGFSVEKSDQTSLKISPTTKKIIPYTDESPFYEEELPGLCSPLYDIFGTTEITVPSFDKLVSDSAKLKVLSQLLRQLKAEGHRVLIFCQMTKMLDILEDFMHTKGYKFFRLDGSTSISDRNEMVQAFQRRNDIFVFLLSTRAGGLGINLTAADTVIFYDNDWNPTSDSQAMDRCHRIGQTKQVTVYRLVTRGTIEERILKIAQQKNVIQNTVYKGQFKPTDQGPTKQEMLALLKDDLDIEQINKLNKKEKVRKKPKKRKTKKKQQPVEEVKQEEQKPDPSGLSPVSAAMKELRESNKKRPLENNDSSNSSSEPKIKKRKLFAEMVQDVVQTNHTQ